MGTIRRIVQGQLAKADRKYQSRHRLQPVGEILVAGRARYRGSPMVFPDGTRLATDECIGALHFDNVRFTQLQAESPRRAALQFSRLMLESMRALARRSRDDPAFSDLAVYHAVSWLPPHGKRIGFVTQPFPAGIRRRILAGYFRLLIWAFAPAKETRASARPDPTIYWLTRRELLRRFGGALSE